MYLYESAVPACLVAGEWWPLVPTKAWGVALSPEHPFELHKGFLLPLPTSQGPEHPNPGKGFTARGFPRHCYLPDSEKGRKVSWLRQGGKCKHGLGRGMWVEVCPTAHPAGSAGAL